MGGFANYGLHGDNSHYEWDHLLFTVKIITTAKTGPC